MKPASFLPDDPLLAAVRSAGARIRRIRYRPNRTVLLSVSADGRTLNAHACFREAPPEIADAVARFLTSRRGSRAAREALGRLREWEGTRRGLEAARRQRPRRTRRRTNGPETAPLRALFDRFNRERFQGRLPDIPLRVSTRMTRSLGTIRYGPGSRGASSAGGPSGVGDATPSAGRASGEGGERASDGNRTITEIAISADLLLPANREALQDTLLHEMAHAEAWLDRGHRGHGAPWRRIAVRVGCHPRASCSRAIARRGGRRR